MTVYKLLYEDTNQKRLDCLGEFPTQEDAMVEMNKYITKKPNYYRFWKEGDTTTIDYGSWSTFFKIKEIKK